MSDSAFIRFLFQHRTSRNWSISEMARRSGLSQPEVSRIESGKRLPTIRHVKGVAEAFSQAPVQGAHEPKDYADWLVRLVDMAERARQAARVGPGRWAKRSKEEVA
jgi:transcriptional regulator with XRE-family HTH domain|tara:strand:- start:192 stop:509 length:318 start_codon:yes stop_codon:yes gene_type:complete